MDDRTSRDSNGLTRRQALAAAAALCGLGAATAASTGVAQAATLRVRLKDYPALRKIGGAATVGSLGGVQVAVVRTARNRYVALDRRCPHAGGIVMANGSQWVCPLHGSRFDLDGDKVSGVTPKGLRKLRSKLSRGVLTITG